MSTATPVPIVKKPGKLPRSAWDFSKLPQEEQEVCFAWEYAREWELLRHRLITMPPTGGAEREAFEADPDAWLGCVQAKMLLSHLDKLETPWQDLSKSVRTAILEEAGSGRAGLEPMKPGAEELEALRGGDSESAGVAVFRVNWEQSDKRLLADFARWLKEERTSPAREQRGRNRRDDLNMLGAMRQLNCLRLEEAIIETTRALGEPLYGKRPSWERARKTALRVFQEDFLVGATRWQEPQMPLSYLKLERE